jgi:hypothetical protein
MTDHKLALLLAAISSTVALSACGDDGTDNPPDETDAGADTEADGSDPVDTGVDVADDTTDDVDGSGSDDGGVDTTEDVEPDAPLPNCDDDERLVGRVCRSIFDRACLDNTHCRENEECTFLDENPLGTCIFTPEPPRACPGAAGCESAEGPLRAAFAKRAITPPGWEFARPEYEERPDPLGTMQSFLGDVSDPDTFCDCGRDMRCPPTAEFDECFSLGDYVGPDADGTENDGYMQGAWIAGFGSSRQAGLCPPELVGPDCEGDACCVHERAHDDLWARGFVLEKGDLRIAVVTVDTVGFFYNDAERAEALLDPSLGIDQLVVTATHTHEAPDTMGRWGPGSLGSDLPTDTGVVPEWQAEIHQAIADVVTEAAGNLIEVDAWATQVNTGNDEFAARDSRDPYVFNDLITAIHFVRAGTDRTDSNNTIGTMINWHSHPEALGGDNPYMTSDFAHYTRQYIEEGFAAEGSGTDGRVFEAWDGYGGVAMYISGSVGGLMTPLSRTAVDRNGNAYPDDGWGKARALGERLADAMFTAFATECDVEPGEPRVGCAALLDTSLAFAEVEFFLDVESVQIQAAAISLGLFDREIYNWRAIDGTRRGTYPKVLTNVTQIRLGELAFQTFPGEVFPEVVLGGYSYDNVRGNVIVGNPTRRDCDDDGIGASGGAPGTGFPCIVRPDNPNPPDLTRADTGDYVWDRVGSEFFVILGLGNDELGYLIPPYDFKVDPNLGALVEVEGDHYEETVSPGEFAVDVINDRIDALNALLEP